MISPACLFFMELQRECEAVTIFREVVKHVHVDLFERHYAAGYFRSDPEFLSAGLRTIYDAQWKRTGLAR